LKNRYILSIDRSDKMSNVSKTMRSVSTAFTFTGDKVFENIMTFVRNEGIEVSEIQMKRLSNIVKSSVEQSFSLTADSIEKSIS
tara:strand:- start:540 stop:791 length:252 start_codon:yes stop_codon:yes gene_type:complete